MTANSTGTSTPDFIGVKKINKESPPAIQDLDLTTLYRIPLKEMRHRFCILRKV